ncbi:MAG: AMP-dependent synthetase and ligase, partial [Frankiales bacterium]|nr:AMP-dependent synthetase and ligase [Frankiales bacterium]
THIGGVQVLVRSLLAGTTPQVLEGPFTAQAFAAVRLTGERRYVSLVPTQLRRLLDAGADLTGYDALLLGGAAAAPSLLERARDAGAHVVTTYGMSETAGGCVYDGVPLDGVRVSLSDGLVRLAGPVLASGYRLRPDLTATAFGPDGFTTSDLGRLDDGVLTVLGRADDVIVTGGEKVAPLAVEAALQTHPAVVEAGVVGQPDDEWGARVVAHVVLRGPLTLDEARDHVSATLPRAWAPRELVAVTDLPVLASGKLDRAGLGSRAR